MSTTIEMTSPSSSIVVVDKSGSAEANNLIQTSASQHHLYHHPHQSHQIHAQQVIVNEEYLSAGDHIVSAGNINYLKTNDLLNNAQIIQSTTSFDFGSMRGEAQLISGKTVQQHQHQQHQPKGVTNASSVIGGHTQDDQYHGATTVLPQTITNPNSKVHVISNVTLVSKAQQPHHQSISFVNSGKHVHATHPHAVPMTKATNASVTAKMINIPYKTASVSHVQQLQPQTQSNQSHVITKHLNNPSAIIQKIPIPRNIHVLSTGRIQHQQQQQQQLHHHISDESVAIAHAQIARNTAPSHQTSANVVQIQKQNAIGKSNLNFATVKTAATTTTVAASVAKKHQTVKLINQTTSVVTPQGHQQYTIQSQHVPINHQIKAKPSAQQRVYLTSTYNNDYHYQHAGVQQPNEHANKNGPEYFRVNTSDIQSTTSTFVDNIPLISARTDEASGYQPHGGPNDQDDDIIGEEVRPQPIDSSMDARMRALHALLQDHTYVHLPKKTATANSGTTVEQLTAGQHPAQQQMSVNIMPSQSQHSAQPQPAPVQQLQPHQPQQRHPTTVADSYRRHLPELVSAKQTTVSTTSSASSQAATSPFIPGFPFTYNALAKDDDAHSVISTGSRNNLDIDLGEETETAPEGEGEDDSVTRCICELAHDDGYMICCDKCSVWQHVDCMGIDRQNIPEEYKCELCQPRPVDHNRARTLQLMKRKEQQNFLLMGSSIGTTPLSPSQQHQPIALAGQQTVNERSSINDQRSMAGQLAVNEWRHNQLNAFSTIAANKKKGTLNKKGRKDKSESASSSASKRKRSELSASRAASAKQRREAKKSSKRKSISIVAGAAANVTSPSQLPSQADSSEMSTSSAAAVTAVSAATAAAASDKQAANLRAWIENYEAAMTNHYSPELRARLHAMGKQTQSQNNNTIVSMLKHVGTPENKCTTVPHGGGKILISTLDIYPKNPVIEMRGKYMLSTQYQQQQTTATTTTTTTTTAAAAAAPTVASGTVPSNHTAGPFLFFYRLPNDGPEICVDTRTYGNEARFVRRSCRPNAEILHTIDKGTLHLYIVSLATIKSSTEITIKHEPHDLEWLARGEISAPTSTICACGLIKECPFGGGGVGSGGTAAPNANPNTLPTSLSTAAQKKMAKRSNGHIKEMKGKIGRFNHGNRDLASRESSRSASSSMRKKKSSSSANRNRSRSSSSDQVSKSVHNNATKQLPGNVTNSLVSAPNAIAVVSAEVTSAANALNALASSPKSRAKAEDAIETSTVVATALHLKSPEKLNHVVFGVANGTCHVDIDKPSTSPRTLFGQTSPRPVGTQSSIPSDTSNVGDTPATPDKPSDEKVLKSPPLTPVSSGGNQRVASATKSLSHKKSARKSTCSLSEDNSSVAGDEFAVSSPNAMWRTQAANSDHNKTSAKPEKAVENKKLTREERKMEAIVRAFEKMEKTEQRKNEQNKKSHPTGSGPNSGSAVGNTSNTSRKRSISSSQKDKMDDEKSTPTKRSSLQQGRRKRKRGKSYSQSNHQRRRRNRHDSQNSEIGTSEDSAAGVSPCFSKFHQNLHTDVNSSDIIPKFGGNIAKHDDLRRPHDVGLLKKSSESDLAADLLLSLSADHSSATSSMSAFPVSSACLLIEAAVGPLGHDFKLPTKAKTKKSIMNDWLHQSDASAAHSPHSDSTDQNMLSPNSSYGNVRHDSPCFSKFQISPELTAACEFGRNMAKQSDHSISMAAQKIEEFIQLSTASSSASAAVDHIGDDDESSSKWSVSNDVQTVPTPMPTPPLQLGSSVKKRWLRQAISEECSDEMLANSSATSSPPNGFMAPLKKRRVARQCSDMNAADDLPSPVFATSHDASEEKPPFVDRLDIEMNEEESSNAAPEAEISTPIEVDETDADDDSAHVFVKLNAADTEPIEAKPNIEIVQEIKSENIKLEQEEPHAAVEEFIDRQPEEPKIDIKVEIDAEVEAEVAEAEIKAETNAEIEVKEDEKVEVEVEEEEEEEEKPKIIPETIEQKPPPMDLDSGSSGSTPVDQIDNVDRENDRVENAEKAEIVKIKKIEDTDNNNTEYPNVTALHDVPLPKDEIEDIQQKLHSFHSENLMILQSRNKKRLSRATTPTACDVERVECKVEEPTTNEQVDKTSPSSTPAPPSSTYSPVVTLASKKSIHTMPLNSAAPPLASKVTPNATYGNHWMQRNADGVDIYQQQQTIPPPSFTAIHPHLVGTNASTPYSLYHYLENPNRPAADMAKQKYGKARSEGTAQNHVKSWQNCHPNIPAPTLLNSSNYLTKSYSTLSEPTTPVSAVSVPPVANLASTAVRIAQENSAAIVTAQEKSNVMVDAGLGQIDVARRQFGLNQPKMSPAQVNLAGERTGFVLTRTQSADPRLNPPKDLPPVTPKRKLSINEYRKRKQLISGGTSNVGADKVKTPETPPTPEIETSVANTNILDAVKPKNGLAVPSETKETVFSPAPTLLELQQESLSQRLKSYKSLHEMSTSKPKDATTENDELNLLRNLEPSSILSSSNSSSLRSSPSLKSFDGDSFDAETNEPSKNENIEADDFLNNDIQTKSTICDIPLTKKTATQATVTSSVTAITPNENDVSEPVAESEPTSRDADEIISATESQASCEPTSAGNISPNENTSR